MLRHDMATDAENAAIVDLWFRSVWAGTADLGNIDRLASPDLVFQYTKASSLRGPMAVKAFSEQLRNAFPDIRFQREGALKSQSDTVVYEWEGAGTHTGAAFSDFLIGPLPENSGEKIRISGVSIVRLLEGKIIEEAIWSKARQAEIDPAFNSWVL
jgi:hypothetical protein